MNIEHFIGFFKVLDLEAVFIASIHIPLTRTMSIATSNYAQPQDTCVQEEKWVGEYLTFSATVWKAALLSAVLPRFGVD